jgi:hypothetical protein
VPIERLAMAEMMPKDSAKHARGAEQGNRMSHSCQSGSVRVVSFLTRSSEQSGDLAHHGGQQGGIEGADSL